MKVFDFFRYLESGSLAGLVKKFKVQEPMIARYIEQVLTGLCYLHEEGNYQILIPKADLWGIIHRDIKGDNVLLSGNKVKLADFGTLMIFEKLT